MFRETNQEINFNLVLKRRAFYPVMTLVIPCVITAVLLCLTFLMPSDAGEKVGLSKFEIVDTEVLQVNL